MRKNLKWWTIISATILGACAIVAAFITGGFRLFNKLSGEITINYTIAPANPVLNNSSGVVPTPIGTTNITSTSVKHDPIEDDPKLRPIVKTAQREAEEELGGEAKLFGSCHKVWFTQQRILKEKYGINWKTPDEMNPGSYFD